MFKGSIVALVTPFKNNQLDEVSFRRLIQFHVENGTNGILVAGCTGEAANLSLEELRKLILWARAELSDRDDIVLLAGTGTNTTRGTIERTRAAVDIGVDAVLLITPYYNKPTPAGQIAHYSRVAESVDAPIILYNVPGRTGVNMLPETIAELAKIDNIVAVKEAGGNVDQVSEIKSLSDITILSGDDTLTLPMLAAGAEGVISVTANIAPAKVSAMCAAWLSGDFQAALEYHLELFHLSKMLFIETNPMPVKAALEIMGLITGDLRLPLVRVTPGSETIIRDRLLQAGLVTE